MIWSEQLRANRPAAARRRLELEYGRSLLDRHAQRRAGALGDCLAGRMCPRPAGPRRAAASGVTGEGAVAGGGDAAGSWLYVAAPPSYNKSSQLSPFALLE